MGLIKNDIFESRTFAVWTHKHSTVTRKAQVPVGNELNPIIDDAYVAYCVRNRLRQSTDTHLCRMVDNGTKMIDGQNRPDRGLVRVWAQNRSRRPARRELGAAQRHDDEGIPNTVRTTPAFVQV